MPYLRHIKWDSQMHFESATGGLPFGLQRHKPNQTERIFTFVRFVRFAEQPNQTKSFCANGLRSFGLFGSFDSFVRFTGSV